MCNEPVTTTTKIIMIIICDLLLWDLNFFTFFFLTFLCECARIVSEDLMVNLKFPNFSFCSQLILLLNNFQLGHRIIFRSIESGYQKSYSNYVCQPLKVCFYFFRYKIICIKQYKIEKCINSTYLTPKTTQIS